VSSVSSLQLRSQLGEPSERGLLSGIVALTHSLNLVADAA
jgi:hypothetical protein